MSSSWDVTLNPWKEEDIIQENQDKLSSEESKNMVHKTLKGSPGICETITQLTHNAQSVF